MTTATDTSPARSVLGGLDAIIKPLESLYRDLHTHPELSDHEKRTAAKAAEQLEWAGCEVSTGVGGTGVVGVLRNGDGPTVMLRADMDALPVKEDTGLPYASHRHRDRPRRAHGPRHARLRARHACHLAVRRHQAAGASPDGLARNAHLAVPTSRRAGNRSAGDD